MDQNFPRPLVIGKNDLVAQGWKGPWDKPGTIGLTVDSTVLVPFASADGSLMLKGLMDTGAGPSIMGISAWKRLNLGVELDKKPCSLVAVNKNPITTYGLASSVRFMIAGIELETTFIIVEDLCDEDFILGRTFIRMHDVLLDLNRREMVIRNPNPCPVAAVSENAVEAEMELAEAVVTESGQIALCKLRLKDTKVFKNRKTDVMIGSDDNSDIVIGWTLATVDTEGCTVASVLNVSGGTLRLKEGQSMARCAVIRTANFNSCISNVNLEMTCDNDRVEAIKSCSSYSTCSPDDVLSNRSEFPTDGLREEVKRTLPDIERLKRGLVLNFLRSLNVC